VCEFLGEEVPVIAIFRRFQKHFIRLEAFTPEQFAELYDVNVLRTQRVNRAALPQLRSQGRGLLVWVSSSSVAGGRRLIWRLTLPRKPAWTPRPCNTRGNWRSGASKTSIILPGAFTKGTNHFAHAGVPADEARLGDYEAGPYKGYGKKIQEAFAAIVPNDADVSAVAEAIVKVVDAPFGKRPFRVHIDPTQDGAEVVFGVMDRVRTEMLHRVRLDELLSAVKS
jgi:NAD(P)-dependent dehydrogenase (short-subunit alcohol dehydrogenase family)